MSVGGRHPGLLERRRRERRRVAIEDALRLLHAAEERGARASIESLAGSLSVSPGDAADLLRELESRGLATAVPTTRLTPGGRRFARSIVRAHRLWERYLADEVSVPLRLLHRRADRKEHRLGAAELDRLAARLGYPEHDPHGDPIPTSAGELAELSAVPLVLLAPGESGEIVHLEDEPEAVFERLVAQGLEPGRTVTVASVSDGRLAVDVEGVRRELHSVDAANVFVSSGPAPAARPRTLETLGVGEVGRVGALQLTGLARRRLLDLGFTPGAEVECVLVSPFGEPRAYRVRGTLIALRPEQTRRIDLESEEAV